jgi:hypothetical protein
MSDASKDARDLVDQKLEALVALAANEVVRTKLRNIHDVCSHVVVTGRQRLTVPLLLSTYAVRFPSREHSIAESSIRNARGGANPYLELYRAWQDAAEILLAQGPQLQMGRVGEIIGTAELAGIKDPATRHQVKLLMTQNTSLKNQLDILKQVRGAPVITLVSRDAVSGQSLDAPKSVALTESELSAVKDFLAERKMKSRGLVPGDDGSISMRDGRPFADPGFLDGLRKMVEISE